jgi:hypothetical protein
MIGPDHMKIENECPLHPPLPKVGVSHSFPALISTARWSWRHWRSWISRSCKRSDHFRLGRHTFANHVPSHLIGFCARNEICYAEKKWLTELFQFVLAESFSFEFASRKLPDRSFQGTFWGRWFQACLKKTKLVFCRRIRNTRTAS